MSASQHTHGQAPVYFTLLDPEGDRQSGIRGLAEIQLRATEAVRAEMRVARYAEVVKALQERPLHVSIQSLAATLGATHRTLKNAAMAEGLSVEWVPIKTPKGKRVRVKSARRRTPQNKNPPKKPVPQFVEIPCICCGEKFQSWDKKLNRMCKPTCERVVW